MLVYVVSALIFTGIVPRVASATDFQSLINCYVKVLGTVPAAPLSFAVNPSHDGLPAGAYVYVQDRAYFCALPSQPTRKNRSGSWRQWNLTLDVNGAAVPFQTQIGFNDAGTTAEPLSADAGPSLSARTRCEPSESPRMRKALETEILSEVYKFQVSRVDDGPDAPKPITLQHEKVRKDFYRIAEIIDTCAKDNPGLALRLAQRRNAILKFYNENHALDPTVPPSTQ